mmetsp:Transcript_2157/g.5435  ORF Transcript_2157/g.5435 Transcript_2157/m.5435 type:complete len:319 (-) Transcript_2157:1993-2949(-)
MQRVPIPPPKSLKLLKKPCKGFTFIKVSRDEDREANCSRVAKVRLADQSLVKDTDVALKVISHVVSSTRAVVIIGTKGGKASKGHIVMLYNTNLQFVSNLVLLEYAERVGLALIHNETQLFMFDVKMLGHQSFVMNLKTGNFNQISSMPRPSTIRAGVSYDNSSVVVYGYDGRTNNCCVYSVETHEWSVLPLRSDFTFRNFGVTVIRDSVVVISFQDGQATRLVFQPMYPVKTKVRREKLEAFDILSPQFYNSSPIFNAAGAHYYINSKGTVELLPSSLTRIEAGKVCIAWIHSQLGSRGFGKVNVYLLQKCLTYYGG